MSTIHDRSLRLRDYLTFEVPAPIRGLSPLLPTNRTPDGASPTLDDVSIHYRILQKRWGTTPYGNAAGVVGRAQRFTSFLNTAGDDKVVVITTGGLASVEPGPVWTSRAAGKNGSATLVPFYTAYQGKLIIANGNNKLYEWDGVAASAVELTQSPIARTVSNLGGRVLAANIAGGPNVVKWSDYLSSAVWSGGSSGEANLIDTNDEIRALSHIRDQIVILRRNSIWTATTAEYPFYYRFERQWDGIGVSAPGSAVAIPGGVLFLGPDDIYIFDGSAARPFLPNDFSLSRMLEEQTSVDGLRRAVGTAFPSRGQYWLALALGAGVENTHVLVVDYVNRTLVRHRLAFSGVGIAETPLGGFGAWVEYPVFWSSMQVTWATLAPLLRERLLGAFATGPTIPVIYDPSLSDHDPTTSSQVAITQRWQTGLLNFAGEEVYGDDLKVVHRVRVIGERGSNNFKIRVGYSLDGETIIWTQYQAIDASLNEWVFDPSMPTEAQWWAAEVIQDQKDQGTRISSLLFYFTVSSPKPVDLRAWGAAPNG